MEPAARGGPFNAPVQFLREVVKVVRLGWAEQSDRRPALAHFDEAAGRDREALLPVERQVHTVLTLAADDFQADRRACRHDDRALRQRVRRDRRHHHSRQGRIQDRSPGRQAIGGRARRRRNDDSIPPKPGDGPPLDRYGKGRDAADRFSVQDSVVQGAVSAAFCAFGDRDIQPPATVLPEAAGEHLIQARERLLLRQACQIAERSDVDPEHRSGPRGLARHRQEGAVSTEDEDQIGQPGDALPPYPLVPAHCARGVAIVNDVETPAGECALQRGCQTQGRGRDLRDEPDALEPAAALRL